jgi:hypothetical protein
MPTHPTTIGHPCPPIPLLLTITSHPSHYYWPSMPTHPTTIGHPWPPPLYHHLTTLSHPYAIHPTTLVIHPTTLGHLYATTLLLLAILGHYSTTLFLYCYVVCTRFGSPFGMHVPIVCVINK